MTEKLSSLTRLSRLTAELFSPVDEYGTIVSIETVDEKLAKAAGLITEAQETLANLTVREVEAAQVVLDAKKAADEMVAQAKIAADLVVAKAQIAAKAVLALAKQVRDEKDVPVV